MRRLMLVIGVSLWLLVGPLAWAAEPPLSTATGVVVKANADVILVRPRNAEGQFERAIALKVRGTSKTFTMSMQTRNKQTVFAQRETDPKDLQPNQVIAVIYTATKDELILLSAVAR